MKILREIKCKYGKDCEACKTLPPFTGLPYNEKLVDFIRWKELWSMVAVFTFFIGVMGYWGILIGGMFHYCMGTLGGGMQKGGEFPKEKPKIKYKAGCSKGPCSFCARIQ